MMARAVRGAEWKILGKEPGQKVWRSRRLIAGGIAERVGG